MHGRGVQRRLVIERRDKQGRSPCPAHTRHLVVPAINLPQIPLMDAFAAKHYPSNTVSVNLMQHERLRTLFETIDLEPKVILDAISIATHKRIEPGKTLLIIDEIQEAPYTFYTVNYRDNPNHRRLWVRRRKSLPLSDRQRPHVSRIGYPQCQARRCGI